MEEDDNEETYLSANHIFFNNTNNIKNNTIYIRIHYCLLRPSSGWESLRHHSQHGRRQTKHTHGTQHAQHHEPCFPCVRKRLRFHRLVFRSRWRWRAFKIHLLVVLVDSRAKRRPFPPPRGIGFRRRDADFPRTRKRRGRDHGRRSRPRRLRLRRRRCRRADDGERRVHRKHFVGLLPRPSGRVK